MKKTQLLIWMSVIIMMFVVPGCAVIGGIFKAGMGVGILLVVVVVAAIIWLLSRMGKKNP